MVIKESGEMYLETILILSKKKNMVRSIDIAEYMGFSKPSVSRANISNANTLKIIILPHFLIPKQQCNCSDIAEWSCNHVFRSVFACSKGRIWKTVKALIA